MRIDSTISFLLFQKTNQLFQHSASQGCLQPASSNKIIKAGIASRYSKYRIILSDNIFKSCWISEQSKASPALESGHSLSLQHRRRIEERCSSCLFSPPTS
mmetsp:Transcript_31681/g.66171  ORF Transcript_31681/g.66171 Transcript_31681/m.66171 type:complete len:101 (+) Transcript_31681:81-383(+)